MFLTGKHLSRRAVLKGLGATIALPFLDAMVESRTIRSRLSNGAQGHGGKLRLICIEQVHGAAGSSAYGLQHNLWSPALTGRDFDLSPSSLKPLEAWRDHVTIISNCDEPSADPTDAREIVRDAKKNDYRLSSFILGVVKSPAFRMSRVAPSETTEDRSGGAAAPPK